MLYVHHRIGSGGALAEMDDRLRLELVEDAGREFVVRQVPFPERNLHPEVILESKQSLGHPVNRGGAPRPHLMNPPPSKERVHTGNIVAAGGQVLGERPPQVTIETGDEYPHNARYPQDLCYVNRRG